MTPSVTKRAKGWSIPHTSRRVFAELEALDWTNARVCDVGAGRGAFSQLVGEWLVNEKQLDPRAHLCACDLIPASFEYEGVACAKTNADGTLPFPDDHFDATVSIEVVEHVQDQFAFLRELARVTKPGGRVIVTTARLARKRPEVLAQNRALLTAQSGWKLLTGRTTVLVADKPGGPR